MDEIVPNLQPVKFLNDQTFFQIKKSSYSTVEPLQNSQPILLGTSANIEKRRFITQTCPYAENTLMILCCKELVKKSTLLCMDYLDKA